MTPIELLLLAVLLYYVITAICAALIDCNLELWWKEHFGQPISVLQGQVVWITGASSGIGRELSLDLARHGVRLVISARRKELLNELRTECLEQARGRLSNNDVFVLPMNVLETETHEKCFKLVLDHFGQLDVLVNNAGRSQRACWENVNVQVDRDLFELDVFAAVNLSRIAIRYFKQQTNGRGHIAVNSSMAGYMPVPFSCSYVAAKHALNAYMCALRVEHPEIDVTIFAPGPVQTDFLKEAFTAEPGIKVERSTADDKRLRANRCGHLFAVTIANKMPLTWCGIFPVNIVFHICRNPTLYSIFLKVVGRGAMNKVREGKA